MSTNVHSAGHNVPVNPLRRASTVLTVALIAPALLLSGCGSTDTKAKPAAKPSVDLPTGDVEIPDGITLTKAGTELAFTQPALVAYEPNTQRSSVLSLSVDSVQVGKLSDFAAYQLDDRTKKSKPYYVKVSVKNVGSGDLSRAAVPLYAVDNRNALIQQSTFNNNFAKCPSPSLPAGFVQGQSFQGCLVYLVPDAGTLVEMSFRPLQAFEPITWKGDITPATTKKAATKKAPAKKSKKKGTQP